MLKQIHIEEKILVKIYKYLFEPDIYNLMPEPLRHYELLIVKLLFLYTALCI
jgi:hypothetical protein